MVNAEWLKTFEGWLPELQAAIRQSLEAVTRGRPDLVAVGIVTDSDGRTLQPVALSHVHLAELVNGYPEHAASFVWGGATSGMWSWIRVTRACSHR